MIFMDKKPCFYAILTTNKKRNQRREIMKGYLVINAFLQTKKFKEIYEMLQASFLKRKVEIQIKTNVELMVIIQNQKNLKIDFVLFWDKDVFLAHHLENRGIRVFNSSKVIEICDDKGLTALYLENHQIPMPKTILAPFTYQNIGYPDLSFLKMVTEQLSFPFIVKENKGSFGQQVYLVQNQEELHQIVMQIGCKNMLFQEYIASSHGQDVRLYVIGKKVVLAVKRIANGNDFCANVSHGGKMIPFTPDSSYIDLAEKVATLLNVDFAGIDLLIGDHGQPLFCEINSNAHFKNVYLATGVDLSILLVDYILEQLS